MNSRKTVSAMILAVVLALIVAITPTLAEVTFFSKWPSRYQTMTISNNSGNITSWSNGAAKWRNATNFKVSTTFGSATTKYFAYDVNDSTEDWDGIATTTYSASGGITRSNLRLNLYYVNQSKYTSAIKAGVTGHEVGHSLGLNHTSVVETSSIMHPYTFNTNGTTARALSPSSSDIRVVNALYSISSSSLEHSYLEPKEEGIYLTPSWSVYYKDEVELKNAADLVISGKVKNRKGSEYVDKAEYHTYSTKVNVQVNDVLKGKEVLAGKDIIISQMGGIIGDIKVIGEHTTMLEEGKEVVLFLRKNDDNTYRTINEDDGIFVKNDNAYKNISKDQVLKSIK